MTQLALWDTPDADRPLPELIASGGEDWQAFALASRDVQGTRYYAVQDWIRGIAVTEEPRKFWHDIKRRSEKAGIELSVRCRQLPYKASNGRIYQMDYADAETLYLITQRMDTDTGIRNKILAYLARAGVTLDEMRLDPGKAIDAGIAGYTRQDKDERWIASRVSSKISRQQFTNALRDALAKSEPQVYGKATNAVYVGLWNRTAEQLREEFGLSKRTNLRDYLPHLALNYSNIAESIIAQELGTGHNLTWAQAEQIIKSVAALIKPQIEAVSGRLGVDLATGRPLLQKGGDEQA